MFSKIIIIMKKIALISLSSVLLFACQPKDKQPPLIFLKGNNPYIVSLNSWFKDPGANAEDNKDKDITSKIVMTHNVDINGPTNGEGTTKKAGTYTVTYTCKDNAGNVATKTRTVIVKNDAAHYATRYECIVDAQAQNIVRDTVIASIDLTVDATTNMKIWFPKLGGKTGLRIYGQIQWNNNTNYYHVNIPDQKIPMWENNTRYLYGVMGILNDSKILDSIDPKIEVKYHLTKYRKSPQGTVIWPPQYPDSLWEVLKNDVVIDKYDRF
jgi:hypothetical protein